MTHDLVKETETFTRDLLDYFLYNKYIYLTTIKTFLYQSGNEKLNKELFDDYTVRQLIDSDVTATFNGDPAADSEQTIRMCYPGVRALAVHRVAHLFYNNGAKQIARIMSEMIHRETGIDINPGAKIGKNCMIDHGTGIVIGETTIIGDSVKIYQGVTLGAKSVTNREQTKRHPTIGNNVIIYANATILGGETVIGDNTVIGGNAFVTKSIDANSVVRMDGNIFENKEKLK